ncbi:MAG: hypothetical protein AB1391_03125 [Candidatus Micrarchaeota archaeon]
MKPLLAILLLFSFSFAATNDYKATNGLLNLSTKITISPIFSINSSIAKPGDSIAINLSLQEYYIGSDFEVDLTANMESEYDTNKSVDKININFVNESEFSNISWYHNNCGFIPASPLDRLVSCTNVHASTCRYIYSPYNNCQYDILNGKISGKKNATYYESCGYDLISKHGNAEVGALCYGTWYINGTDTKKTINSTLTAFEITIPLNATPDYEILVEAKYKCLIVAASLYDGSNDTITTREDMIYYNPTVITDSFKIDITLCGTPGINVVGIDPIPIHLANNNATINIYIQNNGTVALNITKFSADNDFIFTPLDMLPILINTGDSKTVSGTLSYTGTGSPPSKVTLSVYANASQDLLCQQQTSSEVSSNITVDITSDNKLKVLIQPADNPMTLLQTSNANVTVSNNNNESIDNTNLTVQIAHCLTSQDDCFHSLDTSSYDLGILDPEENKTKQTNYYTCENNDWGIKITANVSHGVAPTSADDTDVVIIPCISTKETCKIEGVSEMFIPKEYKFAVICNDSNKIVNCSEIVKPFDWTYKPSPIDTPSFLSYDDWPKLEGDVYENITMKITNIFSNGILNISVHTTTKDSLRNVHCNRSINVTPNVCVLHI